MKNNKKIVKKKANKAKIKEIKISPLNFGEAVELMKMGRKAARKGWNGKKMFIIYIPETKKAVLKAGTPYANAMKKRKTVTINAHFDMFTANKTMQPGWLASQSDMLADDWEVVK